MSRSSVFTFACFVTVCSGSSPHSKTAVRGDLILEIADALDSPNMLQETFIQATERDLPEIEEALRPMLAMVPKSEHGKVAKPAVRYLLHRLFKRRHGWSVLGLDPEGQNWDSASPTNAAVFDQLPKTVHVLFDQLFGETGLAIQEIAVLAVTMEYLIHREAVNRLLALYDLKHLPIDNGTRMPLDSYLVTYIHGVDPASMTLADLQVKERSIGEVLPAWPTAQKFMYELEQSIVPGGAFSLADAIPVVKKVGERYAYFQAGQCQSMKEHLMNMDEQGTGRVHLADFYGEALYAGKWQFAESVEYLRTLGALDETSPSNPRVVISNYINGASNCIPASQFYAVCCLSECEGLLARLEASLGTPDALPADVSSLIASLPSSTVPANRTLSSLMLHRLQGIAHNNGGRIPLQGRLFAQWMHHAYPRECPYPHRSGTTIPQHTDDWEELGMSIVASEQEMFMHADEDTNEGGPVEFAPWTHDEELVVPRSPGSEYPAAWMMLHALTLCATFVTAGLFLARTARSMRRAVQTPSCPELDGKKADLLTV